MAFRLQGVFDAARLIMPGGDGSSLPTLTYQSAEARHVLDQNLRPVNPPRTVVGGLSPKGFLLSPPVLLTNIPAALQVLGDRGINAVRVQVGGAEHLTPENVARVRAVARQIEQQTGLVAEVTMGSSPIQVLLQVPSTEQHAELGWVEQSWIHKNAAVTSVTQAEFGYGLYVVLVLAVACLYVITTGLTGVAARRRELGLVKALGWPTATIVRVAVTEQAGLALLAALLATLSAAVQGAPLGRLVQTVVAALVLYLPGAMAVGYATSSVKTGEALRWGDVAPGRRMLPGVGVVPLALASLMGRPWRTVLIMVAAALPTALLVVLRFVGRHLNGVLYTTLVGEYAALSVGPFQYAAAGVALAVAAMSAFDLIRQNAVDHRGERVLLSALGWPFVRISLTLVVEGGLLGMVSGAVGGLAGTGLLALLYGRASMTVWQEAMGIALIPLVLGLLSGVLGALVERKAWGRGPGASTHPRNVLRFGRPTRIGAALFTATMLAAIVLFAWPRLVAERPSRSVDAPGHESSAELAAAVLAIEERVRQQEASLNVGDAKGYLETVDAAAIPYRAEQQHWVEDLAVWRQQHEGEEIRRRVAAVALVDATTARVHITQSIPGQSTWTEVTIWVRGDDLQWSEHGLDREVLAEEGAVIWYPTTSPEEEIRTLAMTIRQARSVLQEKMGWSLSRAPTFDVKADVGELRTSLGPYLATRPILNWTEYGEPVRIPLDGPGWSLDHVVRWLSYQAVMEQSNNHASWWWREGLTRYVLNRTGLHQTDPLDLSWGEGPVDLGALSTSIRDVDLNEQTYEHAANSAWLLAMYLENAYSPGTLDAVLRELGQRPVDPRMNGPETAEERHRATLAAIEKVTGRRWADLQAELHNWFQHSQRR